VKTLFMLFCV